MADARICVVGGGAAGTGAALRGAELGAEVALIERDDLGGAWLNRGPLPLAVLRHLAREGSDGGWVAARDAAIAAAAAARADLRGRLDAVGVTVVAGDARITAPDTVEVDTGDEVLAVHAPTLVIAAGAEIARPEGLDFGDPRILDASQLLGLPGLPERAVVTGGGPVAVAAAWVLALHGVHVVLAAPGETLLGDEEPDAVAAFTAGLAAAGVEVLVAAAVAGVDAAPEALTVGFTDGSSRHADLLVVASGRVPGTAGLGVTLAGATLDAEGFIAVDDALRVADGDVYAAGDVLRGMPMAHQARAQGERAVEYALGAARRRDLGAVPRAVTGPLPFAAVGLTSRRAGALGRTADVVTVAAPDDGPAGRVVLLVERASGVVLGLTAVGAGAVELVSGAAVPLVWGCTTAELAGLVAPGDGLAELLVAAADRADAGG